MSLPARLQGTGEMLGSLRSCTRPQMISLLDLMQVAPKIHLQNALPKSSGRLYLLRNRAPEPQAASLALLTTSAEDHGYYRRPWALDRNLGYTRN